MPIHDNVIWRLMMRQRRRGCGRPDRAVLLPGLAFALLCGLLPVFLLLLPFLLPLAQLFLVSGGLRFIHNLQAQGVAEELLATPIDGKQFAEAYLHLFLRGLRTCSAILIACTLVVAARIGFSVALNGLPPALDQVNPYALLFIVALAYLGLVAFGMGWMVYWILLKNGLVDALLAALFMSVVVGWLGFTALSLGAFSWLPLLASMAVLWLAGYAHYRADWSGYSARVLEVLESHRRTRN